MWLAWMRPCQVWFLSAVSLGVFSFVISASVSASASASVSVSVSVSHSHPRRHRLPLCPAAPLSITAYQGAVAGSEYLRTLGKFHARPLIKNVPFNFFLSTPLMFLPPPVYRGETGWLWRRRQRRLLLLGCARCNPIKTDTARLKAERLFDSVCLSQGSLCLGVGVHDRCAADVSVEYLQDGCCKGGRELPPIEQQRRAHVFFISGTAGIYSVCSELCSVSHWLRHSLA